MSCKVLSTKVIKFVSSSSNLRSDIFLIFFLLRWWNNPFLLVNLDDPEKESNDNADKAETKELKLSHFMLKDLRKNYLLSLHYFCYCLQLLRGEQNHSKQRSWWEQCWPQLTRGDPGAGAGARCRTDCSWWARCQRRRRDCCWGRRQCWLF